MSAEPVPVIDKDTV